MPVCNSVKPRAGASVVAPSPLPYARSRGKRAQAGCDRQPRDALAEGEGFEPPIRFPVQRFSRPPPSTTRPSLRAVPLRITEHWTYGRGSDARIVPEIVPVRAPESPRFAGSGGFHAAIAKAAVFSVRNHGAKSLIQSDLEGRVGMLLRGSARRRWGTGGRSVTAARDRKATVRETAGFTGSIARPFGKLGSTRAAGGPFLKESTAAAPQNAQWQAAHVAGSARQDGRGRPEAPDGRQEGWQDVSRRPGHRSDQYDGLPSRATTSSRDIRTRKLRPFCPSAVERWRARKCAVKIVHANRSLLKPIPARLGQPHPAHSHRVAHSILNRPNCLGRCGHCKR
jgi:hypothetical protein